MVQNRIPIKERIKNFNWKFEGRDIPIGAGCAYFGAAEDYRETLDGDLKMLDRLYGLGFRYYDTSRTYKNSEQSVGEFIKRIDRETIFLATKSIFPHKREKDAFRVFRENFFASFERLRTDRIDLFQIHEVDYFDSCEAQVLPFLLEQRDKGLIDYIGLGTRSLNAHELAILSGKIDSVLSYMNYSLLKRSAAHVIDLARSRGVAFINASVLHFGAIKHPNPANPGEGDPKTGYRARNLRSVAPLQALCRNMGVDAVHASLQYPLFNPGVTMTLNGIRRDANIDSTVEAMRAVIRPEQWARIYALREEDPYLYVQDDLLD
jgi:aryl-alcohol dehydrogenase-like predicted oxidoreductase